MDRRTFLKLGAGALGAAALAACGGAKKAPKSATPSDLPSGPPEPVQALIDARVKEGATAGLEVYQGSSSDLAGVPNYLPFAMGDNNKPSWGHPAKVWLVSDPQTGGTQVGPLDAPYRAYAHPPEAGPQGVTSVVATFDKPGIWYLVAEAEINGTRRVGSAAYSVGAPAGLAVPQPGRPAIASETPTVDNHRGVNPICTRTPPCDLHKVTLAQALKSGKPVVFQIGTPKWCQSRVCGPNLEEVLAVRDTVGDNKAVFVHADVYVEDSLEAVSRQQVGPTFREWGLSSEPWLFLIDRKGIIASRFEGPLTAGQVKDALTPLL